MEYKELRARFRATPEFDLSLWFKACPIIISCTLLVFGPFIISRIQIQHLSYFRHMFYTYQASCSYFLKTISRKDKKNIPGGPKKRSKIKNLITEKVFMPLP